MKKRLLLIFTLLSLFIITPVYAGTTTTTKSKTYYRTSTYAQWNDTSLYSTTSLSFKKTGARLTDNSGYKDTCVRSSSNTHVNKKWAVNSSNLSDVLNTPCVDASDLIYDYSDILTISEENTYKELFKQYKDKYGITIVFVSYNLPYSYDSANEDFIADFYDFNDFGLDKELYDGIIIFRNTYGDDPYYQILSFGNAQLYLYDTRLSNLEDEIFNYFFGTKYTTGLDYILNYIDTQYEKGPLKGFYVDDMGYIHPKFVPNWLAYFFVGGLTGLIYWLVCKGKHKMVTKATQANDYLEKNSFILTKSLDNYIRTSTTSYVMSSSSGGGGGGHSSHGGHSGGGHSSGGGRHG